MSDKIYYVKWHMLFGMGRYAIAQERNAFALNENTDFLARLRRSELREVLLALGRVGNWMGSIRKLFLKI